MSDLKADADRLLLDLLFSPEGRRNPWAGERLASGDWVMCLQGAANRDPDRFTDPERFDVQRNEGPPLSFGSGIHYCLGAGLARAEGDVVLRALLNRFVSIEARDQNPPWRRGLTLRGLAELPVRVTPR